MISHVLQLGIKNFNSLDLSNRYIYSIMYKNDVINNKDNYKSLFNLKFISFKKQMHEEI